MENFFCFIFVKYVCCDVNLLNGKLVNVSICVSRNYFLIKIFIIHNKNNQHLQLVFAALFLFISKKVKYITKYITNIITIDYATWECLNKKLAGNYNI
jgi:hypothetical protein